MTFQHVTRAEHGRKRVLHVKSERMSQNVTRNRYLFYALWLVLHCLHTYVSNSHFLVPSRT